jgi:isopentenyl diphosphate isomerase/L-lactate dehydrogenase-like FMN-dependent dehydrogenase
LQAWSKGGKAEVREFLDQLLLELKIAMFLTGSKTSGDLRGKI